MIAMNQLAIAWAVSAAAVVFICFCTWHNRRSGYQKKQSDVPGIAVALGWLMTFRASLSPEADSGVPARVAPMEGNPVLS
jgi:hypothetical protein